VRNAETELSRIRIHITEYLQVAMDESEDEVPIKAPASGLVLERKVSAGTVVQPAQEAFRMTDPSSLWMIANVSEADLGQLKRDQSVRVLVRAHPGRTFAGRILRLGEALDPTTRTLQVRVLVPNPGGLLKPEMYATAEIQGGGARQALYVPESAVQELNGSRIVFVRTAADRFQARPIDIARVVNGRAEVTAGVNAGDQLAVKGSFILKSQLMRSSLEEE
jgi:RND family efflux transporter MFP subunit